MGANGDSLNGKRGRTVPGRGGVPIALKYLSGSPFTASSLLLKT